MKMSKFVFMNKSISTLALVLLTLMAWGQEKDDVVDYENALVISPTITFQIPGADLADRFGIGYQFGLGLEYKFKKNWLIGGEGSFLFGTQVKETSHIENAITQNGLVITDEGALDDVDLSMRGAVMKVNAGKSFFFKPSKPSSGILLKIGVGYLHHKILIDVNKRISPQLTGDYAKGYDRFSSGFLLTQYIGLVRLEKGKFVNLSIGFEISEGFTKNRRPYDFNLQMPLNDSRVDLMYGIKLSWMIPVYLGQTSSNQYYTY
jgi:hypothetical protein